MDDLDFLLVLVVIAPLEAIWHHTIITLVLYAVWILSIWLAFKPKSGLMWLAFVVLLVFGIWLLSFIVILGLGLPGFAPH